MLSFDRRFFLFAGAAVAGCGFEPVYQSGNATSGLRRDIGVRAPDTQLEFTFVEQMESRLGQATAPKYVLDYSIRTSESGLAIRDANDITRYNVLGTLSYTLRDAQTRKPLIDGTINTFTAYSASEQPVATLAAQRDASDRLMVSLADKAISQLLVRSDEFT
ncbi:LPS assembly lipoprotein LptE [Litoreibacter roseus]|uniref:LPS-assembly lipoprotein n=1 Tax=Litoreibacter roseus TaxID=2601869 RepID=A0A6N6JLG4_9RHOB|nr:LPS assembly lipoprotein LptE [Litoreibacter roseus]GFE66259.1 hypothetical protein KIN_33330 [Litoreibacter roseus]